MAKTTDVVPTGTVTGTDLVVTSQGVTTADLRYAIANGLKLVVEETTTEDDMLLAQLDRGGDESTILGSNALTPLESLLNVPVKVTGYAGLRNSTFAESKLGVFVIFTVTDADGAQYTTSSGSADVIIKLVQLSEAGKVPQAGWTTFQKSDKPTAAGFLPINMRSAVDPSGF